jgi:hypothetical protein
MQLFDPNRRQSRRASFGEKQIERDPLALVGSAARPHNGNAGAAIFPGVDSRRSFLLWPSRCGDPCASGSKRLTPGPGAWLFPDATSCSESRNDPLRRPVLLSRFSGALQFEKRAGNAGNSPGRVRLRLEEPQLHPAPACGTQSTSSLPASSAAPAPWPGGCAQRWSAWAGRFPQAAASHPCRYRAAAAPRCRRRPCRPICHASCRR